MNITKIDIQKTKRFGSSNRAHITIPKIYAGDNQIDIGDEVEFFRGEVSGSDALIILPVKSNGKHKPDSSEKSQES